MPKTLPASLKLKPSLQDYSAENDTVHITYCAENGFKVKAKFAGL